MPMSHLTFKAIFISDIHIGHKSSKVDKLLKFLKEVETKKIFLVGDIIYRNCPKDDAKLKELVVLLKAKDCQLYFIHGNHETQRDALPTVLDEFEFYKNYIYEFANKKVLVEHGDSYDSKDTFLRSLKYVAKRTQVKSKDSVSKANLKRWLHHNLKEIAKLFLHRHFSKYMALRAKKNRCDSVICGHFHVAKKSSHYGINYYNCGDWITNFSYIGHDFSDNLNLYRYK
jgi:UDP-2,3-diacylglucosamine pyrophosphatase LpxH